MARSHIAWPITMGVAVGGFFDGVLLHQILQWHHLLSLVPGAGDLRMQVVWDGWFHALMYVVAAVGFWGLWRRRDRMSARVLAGGLLAGFGLWHVLDSVLSHWVLGIHRIRLDSPDPLMWDLIWFAAFGLAPLAIAALLLRRRGRTISGGGALAVLAVGVVATGAGAWAMQPPRDQPFSTVAFRADLSDAAVMAALAEAGGRVVWLDNSARVAVAELPKGSAWRLYARGALLVAGAGGPAGCAGWSRV